MARPRLISDEQILVATRKAVEEQGPSVSLDVVADRLGVSQPALLKRFGTRKDLLLAALRPPSVAPFEQNLEDGPDDRPFREQLSQVLGWLNDFAEQTTPCMLALRESGIPMSEIFPRTEGEPMPLRIQAAIAGWLLRCSRKGLVPLGDFKVTALTMLSAISARSHMSHLLKRPIAGVTSKDFLAGVTELFDRAIAPKHLQIPLRGRATARALISSRRRRSS